MNRRVLPTFCLFSLIFLFPACLQQRSSSPPQQTQSHKTDLQLEESTEAFLRRLYHSPEIVMEEIPAKFNRQGEKILSPRFSQQEIKNREFIKRKISLRNRFIDRQKSYFDLGESIETRARILPYDRPEVLVDNRENFIRNIHQIDQEDLTSGLLSKMSWSDTYWPIKQGIIGHRYGDPKSPSQGGWKEFYDFTKKNPVEKYIAEDKTKFLSPSEKYDLLIGDPNGELTRSMWDDGRYYFERGIEVESWMGICHGWAPASYMLPRPSKAVKIKSFDGKLDLIFYPSDIKALGSLLWANAPGPIRFIGSRCNPKNPPKDENGRILLQDCFDNNPGTWHLAVVNQIGVSKRSFIIDATYDYEVWNQPVVKYKYRYFNPLTGKIFPKAQNAMIPIESFEKDLFEKYRSPESRQVVGIEMELTYSFEQNPTHRNVDSHAYDILQTVVYRYDLELDEEGDVLGGEWYQNKHPDFLYTPIPNSKAMSAFDTRNLSEWNPLDGPIPSDWSKVGQEAAKHKLPLAKIVETLFNLSSATN